MGGISFIKIATVLKIFSMRMRFGEADHGQRTTAGPQQGGAFVGDGEETKQGRNGDDHGKNRFKDGDGRILVGKDEVAGSKQDGHFEDEVGHLGQGANEVDGEETRGKVKTLMGPDLQPPDGHQEHPSGDEKGDDVEETEEPLNVHGGGIDQTGVGRLEDQKEELDDALAAREDEKVKHDAVKGLVPFVDHIVHPPEKASQQTQDAVGGDGGQDE